MNDVLNKIVEREREREKNSKKNLRTDYIQCESTSDTIEVHRGRNGYEWKGQKGKILEWTLPVLVEKNADEILNKIYSCKEWERYGKGKETSKDSKELRDEIWRLVMPHIDVKSIRQLEKITIKENENAFDDKRRIAMNRTQTKGTSMEF